MAELLPTATAVGGAIVALIILFIALRRKRFGELRAASWLVTIGAIVVAIEHSMWPILNAGALFDLSNSLEVGLVTDPHSRLHFFMAGIFTLVGQVMLVVLGRTLLKQGRREGWYAVAFALIVGGSFDLASGGSWYPKGMPLFRLIGLQVSGWGWQWLYLYFLAWGVALVISYRPMFGKHSRGGVAQGGLNRTGT